MLTPLVGPSATSMIVTFVFFTLSGVWSQWWLREADRRVVPGHNHFTYTLHVVNWYVSLFMTVWVLAEAAVRLRG